eukprot:TRINITY_DN45571_c0_g1_i1.p1 TRINITY_DN45571_c0_g1~~TRINITY_DN45571_c0_g1_i1.p1  ORF type:complete len:338 (-),score=57.21 TRINITY_DN45571_c0_g1_i1:307-1179(-)
MPTVGLGTFMCSNEDAQAATLAALKLGYRHIDTAEGYKNEDGVGAAIKESGLPREEIFLTTKVWGGNTAFGQEHKSFEDVIASCEASLQRLQTSYIDLYLIHAPFAADLRLDQWRAMLELQRRGLCRSVGVSNYGIAHLEEIREAGLGMPAANQLELHPYCQKPELLRYMEERRILPIAYSSLAPLGGWRTASTDWANGKTDEIRARAADAEQVAAVASSHSVSEARVLLRWALQRGFPVLPKSVRPERVAENINVFNFQLTEAEMAALDRMDTDTAMAWNNGLDPCKVP